MPFFYPKLQKIHLGLKTMVETQTPSDFFSESACEDI